MVKIKLFQALVPKSKSLFNKTSSPVNEVVVEAVEAPVDLGLISVAIQSHGCMGLPQELLDHIMETLHHDLRALKACSLTCKAMFASTRRLVHRTLRLNPSNNQSVLTPEEKLRYLRWDYHDTELRFLSFMGERGFLQYTREIHIRMGRTAFTPDILIPHIDHFRSLERVHSLTIESYDAVLWLNHHESSFIHFYPTLTSLTLHNPLNHYRCVLQFALQFPNLDNLSIERLADEHWIRPDLTIPPIIDKSPPLRGHLRLAGVDTEAWWPTEFAHELLSGINFRSVELEDVSWNQAQHILNACADTLESLTITPRRSGQLEHLSYTQNRVLRQLTLRIPFPQVPALSLELTPRTLSTITSPVFSKFVLELGKLPSEFTRPSWEHWGRWDQIDKLFEERLFASERSEFRLVIRTGKLYDRGTFQTHANESFPLLARRGWVLFETSHSLDRYWR